MKLFDGAVRRCVSLVVFMLVGSQFVEAQKSSHSWQISELSEWQQAAAEHVHVVPRKAREVGGAFDLTGNGALLLKKTDPEQPFSQVEFFEMRGRWTSSWHEVPEEMSLDQVETDLMTYGQKLDMTDWTKFSGNPLVAEEDFRHNTDQTLVLQTPGGRPQDQSLVRREDGTWLLFFNHTPTGWPQDYYWSAATAESLAPLQEGKNPFRLIEENYPLYGPIDGFAPNDWIEINGTFYAPDEHVSEPPGLWTSADLKEWTYHGFIRNIKGHDPGIVYDGEGFHLFSENGTFISHCRLVEGAFDLAPKCLSNENVLDVEGHTGDADVSFFNNRWHMFIDTNPHADYKAGYAYATPSAFPYGWRLLPEPAYGPYKPDQGQVWDDPTPEGNEFGTGDPDIALEGETLYVTWERPVGMAYNRLEEVFDDEDQLVEVQVEVDEDGDGQADQLTGWHELEAGVAQTVNDMEELRGRRFRIKLRFQTEKASESPMLRSIKLDLQRTR